MSHVTCHIYPEENKIRIYQNGWMLGYVTELPNGDAQVNLFSDRIGISCITFSDMEIIMDNWNQMKEIKCPFHLTY